jgi:DedD protein
MAESQDVNALRRRGRRRLVGAIALVLLAAIILPMVFDQEPRQGVPPVTLRIPSEDESSFSPKAAALPASPQQPAPAGGSPAPQAKAAPADASSSTVAEPRPATPEREPREAAATPPKAEKKPEAKPEPKPAPQREFQTTAKPEAQAPAKPQVALPAAPAPSGEQFVVPVAALASADKVRELLAALKAASLPYYTEQIATAKGTVTRVRVGPYASRDAAEAAHRKVQSLGLKPGKVLAKS